MQHEKMAAVVEARLYGYEAYILKVVLGNERT